MCLPLCFVEGGLGTFGDTQQLCHPVVHLQRCASCALFYASADIHPAEHSSADVPQQMLPLWALGPHASMQHADLQQFQQL